VGKSTAIRFLCDTVQKANEDVFILHLSLDDMVRETVDGILCNIANIPNSVMETNRFSPEQRERLEEAQDMFRRQWWKQSYYVCGQKKVSSIADAHALIRRIQIRHPNKRIIMITDNLMNLPEVAKNLSKDKRIVVETAINELHILGQTMDVANLTIVELTKGGPYRPSTAMLKETGTLEYRARVILMLHNDLKANRMSKIFWINDNGEKLPVLEIDNAKFKVGAPNKISFLKMDPAFNRLIEASESEATRWNRIVVAEGIKKSESGEDTGTDQEQREML
jgi:replicative DNA helicase